MIFNCFASITFNNIRCSCSTFVWFLSFSWLLSWFLSWLLSRFLSWLLPGFLPWLLARFLAWFLSRFLSCSARTGRSCRIATLIHSAWAPVSVGPALGVLLVTGGARVGDDGAHTLAAAVPVRCRVCRCYRGIGGAATVANHLQRWVLLNVSRGLTEESPGRHCCWAFWSSALPKHEATAASRVSKLTERNDPAWDVTLIDSFHCHPLASPPM